MRGFAISSMPGIGETPKPDRLLARPEKGRHPMKMIFAIIRPAKLESVKEALTEAGVTGLTVLDVQGSGRQRGHVEVYRGREYTVNLIRKVQVQIAIDDALLEKVIEIIRQAARTGEEGAIGDGKIFVLEMPEVVRIRTGERGPAAL